jgi:hypothetical protein
VVVVGAARLSKGLLVVLIGFEFEFEEIQDLSVVGVAS